MKDFFNLYSHGFVRAAVCVPEVRVADVSYNTQQTIGLAKEASAKKALFAIFPELGLSAYSNEDLFHQEALLQRVREALGLVLEKTRSLNTILVVGAPLRVDSFLFNGAIVIYRGRILGVALKSYLPNYREFYEGRQFRPAEDALSKTINLCGQERHPEKPAQTPVQGLRCLCPETALPVQERHLILPDRGRSARGALQI